MSAHWTAKEHRRIFDLAWPLAISQLSTALLLVTDGIVIARLGEEALAGLGLAAGLAAVPLAAGTALVATSRALLSRVQDPQEAGPLHRAALGVALGMGILAMPLAWVVLVVGWSAAPGPAAWAFVGALLGQLAAVPGAFVTAAAAAGLQARGHHRAVMLTSVLANGANVIAAPVAVFGLGPLPAMGLGGAGLVTAGILAAQAAILVGLSLGQPGARDGRVGPHEISRVLSAGAPVAAWQGLDLLAWAGFSGLVALSGPVGLAANVLAMRVVAVAAVPGQCVGEAVGVLVAKAHGASRPDEARGVVRAGVELGLATMGAASLAMALVPGWLVGVFGAPAAVEEAAGPLFMAAALLGLVEAWNEVTTNALVGAGRGDQVLVVGLPAAWLLRIPLVAAATLALGLGVEGAWGALVVEALAVAVVSAALVGRLLRDPALSPTEAR